MAKFTTVKQVKEAIRRQRNQISPGSHPILEAKTADGGYGRLYFLGVRPHGPVTPWMAQCQMERLPYANIFSERSNWVQGGLDRKGLLEWANETLA